MGRLAVPGYGRFEQAMPGGMEVRLAGAEASVAVGVARLGGEARFVTALPDHALGEACLAVLRGHGVGTRGIVRRPNSRLGLYFVEAGVNQRAGQVIYDREHSAFAETPASDYDWEAIFEAAGWLVISGITPALTADTAAVARTAMETAAGRGMHVVLDLNFRAQLWKWDPTRRPRDLASASLRGLMPWVDVLVAAPGDIDLLLDGRFEGEPAAPEFAELCAGALALAYPRLRHIALTLRRGDTASACAFGGLLFDVESGRYHHAPERGRLHVIPHLVDRLGAGDAFTAGLVHALTVRRLADPATAVAFATAAGCLAHSIEGDFNLVTEAEIEALMAGHCAARVRR